MPGGDSDSGILSSSAALILRSGVNPLEGFGVPLPPDQTVGGTLFDSRNADGNNIQLRGSNITTAGGPVIISAGAGTGNINLQIDVSIATSGGDITLEGDVNRAFNLTLDAGATCNISVSGSMRSSTRLNALSIVNANNDSFQMISAQSISQTDGSGTTTFNDTIDTSTIAGISLTGTGFTFSSSVVTTANGPLTINNSGQLTIPDMTYVSITGDFNQYGSGAVSAGGILTNTGRNVAFAGAITPSTIFGISTGACAGNITISGSVDGAEDVSLTAGTGDVLLSGTIGGTTRISALTIPSATNVTMNDVTSASITQSAGTGTTTLSGALNTNGAVGVVLTGTVFSVNDNITTTNAGPLNITHSGQLTVGGSSVLNISGPITVGGAGAFSMGGTWITNNRDFLVSKAVTMGATTSVNTGV